MMELVTASGGEDSSFISKILSAGNLISATTFSPTI